VLGEEQGRIGREGVHRVDDDGKRLVVDLDRVGGVGGLVPALGHDGSDDVADEAHSAGGEDRPVQRGRHHRELLHGR
jgi:hypothetical protein